MTPKYTLCHLTDHHIVVRIGEGASNCYINAETVVSQVGHAKLLEHPFAAVDGCSSKLSSSTRRVAFVR